MDPETFERLTAEATQLKSRMEKLESFLERIDHVEIDEVQKDLLLIQLSAMRTYYNVLAIRIKRL